MVILLVCNVNYVILNWEAKFRSGNGWIRTRAIAVVVAFLNHSATILYLLFAIVLLVVAILVYCEILSQYFVNLSCILFYINI